MQLDKTKYVVLVPSETSYYQRHPYSLIKAYAVQNGQIMSLDIVQAHIETYAKTVH